MEVLTCIASAVFFALSAFSHEAYGQAACSPPLFQSFDSGSNIFSPPLEIELGDVMAEQFLHSAKVADDPAATAYLNQIGDRISRHLPGPQVKFRYFLIDAPYPNAFSLPGGRIYVTRGMAAFARNEDELAGVLGHEMGHIMTRQGVISLSALMRDVLGVNGISNRRDIVVNLARLQESWQRNPRAFREVKSRGIERESAPTRLRCMRWPVRVMPPTPTSICSIESPKRTAKQESGFLISFS